MILTLIIFIIIASSTSAQVNAVPQPGSILESNKQNHPVKWICYGDTLASEMSEEYGYIVQMDGFWITCEEITQDLWEWYMRSNPSEVVGDSMPVTGISKDEVEEFCHQVNISTGHKWRLPTKKEWLTACRGGAATEHYIYSGSNHHNLVAWTHDNSKGKPHRTSLLIPNETMLYDMDGNVAEMVTEGDSILFMGGSYLDKFPSKNKKNTSFDHSFPTPPPKAQGFRIVQQKALWFDIYGECVPH